MQFEADLPVGEALGDEGQDRLFPFESRLSLEGITGEVTLRCETDDPSGGAEGPGPAVDTKTITVR